MPPNGNWDPLLGAPASIGRLRRCATAPQGDARLRSIRAFSGLEEGGSGLRMGQQDSSGPWKRRLESASRKGGEVWPGHSDE